MILYKKGDITISTITESDTGKVLQYFSENDFNCRGESAALRPTNAQFMCIMKDIISGKDDESNIFVLKKNGEPLGYVSCYVEYDNLHIGHIAVDKAHRGKGYGKKLTKLAISVAESTGRDVSLYCSHPDALFAKMDFEKLDGVHYHHKQRKFAPKKKYPPLFVDKDTYRARQESKIKQETDSFKKFLESDTFKSIMSMDINRYDGM